MEVSIMLLENLKASILRFSSFTARDWVLHNIDAQFYFATFFLSYLSSASVVLDKQKNLFLACQNLSLNFTIGLWMLNCFSFKERIV